MNVDTLADLVRHMDDNAVWKTSMHAFGGYTFESEPYHIEGRLIRLTDGLPRMLYREIPIQYRVQGKRQKSTMPGWTIHFYEMPIRIDKLSGDLKMMAEDWAILVDHCQGEP